MINAKPQRPRLYTLEVFIIGGPISEKFPKRNPVISRTIQIRGDQTLEDLHHAIFDAFDRWEEHMYEFQFGKGPNDPKGKRYVPYAAQDEGRMPLARWPDDHRLPPLEGRSAFGYWFDFGDDWWHQINVEAIEEKVPRASFPRSSSGSAKARRSMRMRTTYRNATICHDRRANAPAAGTCPRR